MSYLEWCRRYILSFGSILESSFEWCSLLHFVLLNAISFLLFSTKCFVGKGRLLQVQRRIKRLFLNDCWVSHIPNPTVCLCPFSRKSSPIDKTRGFDHTHTSMHAPRVQQGITIVLETERRVYRRGNRVKGEPSCSAIHRGTMHTYNTAV